MYIMEDMIELGLKEDQEFPTDAHRRVAASVALCNPNVTNYDKLTNIVQCIISIPNDKIKLVTFEDLKQMPDMPIIF